MFHYFLSNMAITSFTPVSATTSVLRVLLVTVSASIPTFPANVPVAVCFKVTLFPSKVELSFK